MNETSPSLLRNKTFLILGLFFLITLYCLISGLNPQLRRHFHLRND